MSGENYVRREQKGLALAPVSPGYRGVGEAGLPADVRVPRSDAHGFCLLCNLWNLCNFPLALTANNLEGESRGRNFLWEEISEAGAFDKGFEG